MSRRALIGELLPDDLTIRSNSGKTMNGANVLLHTILALDAAL